MSNLNKRLLNNKTTLGENYLLLTQFRGFEKLSKPFVYYLNFHCYDTNINPATLIGSNISWWINGKKIRYFNGIIKSFTQKNVIPNKLCEYSAEVIPWLYLLKYIKDCRNFQEQTKIEIISQLFKEKQFYDFEFSNLSYRQQIYHLQTQYNESTLHFISRLLEQEGIYYYFQHYQQKHVLQLADDTQGYQDFNDLVIYSSANISVQETIYTWSSIKNIQSTSFHSSSRPSCDKLTTSRGINIMASSNHQHFNPGTQFELVAKEKPNIDGSYVITQINHYAQDYSHLNHQKPQTYYNHFHCIPVSVSLYIANRYKKPKMFGSQSAIVTGPKDDDIYTNEVAQIKVSFYWNRRDQKDQHSSSWIPIIQFWTGKQYGAQFIPHIDQEVNFEFLNGNPDSPIVTGNFYNANNMPPYALPWHKSQSGIKTHSLSSSASRASREKVTKTYHTSSSRASCDKIAVSRGIHNQIQFDDKKGYEQINLNAHNNLTYSINNNEITQIGHNDRLTITQGQQAISVAGLQQIAANKSIEFRVGHSYLKLTPMKITIAAKKIQFNCN